MKAERFREARVCAALSDGTDPAALIAELVAEVDKLFAAYFKSQQDLRACQDALLKFYNTVTEILEEAK